MHPSITKQLVEEHHSRLRADATPCEARHVPRPTKHRSRSRDKVGAALIRLGTRLTNEPARGGVETWTTCGATSK